MAEQPPLADEPTSREVRERAQAYFEAAAAYQSRMLELSSSYNQIVVLAGYAGFFTIWSATAHDLPRWVVLLSGALMGVSLTVYVGWTVIGMIMLRTQMQRLLDALNEGYVGYLERVQAAEAKGAVASNKIMKWWKPVLWAAGAPAALATTLLTITAFVVVVTS